ncbi:MAG TPA: HlyD family secretion protein [Stellaceae bacterium]|jgi:membrane fusion protein (multidrug efflux system)|nr:HlyD family secretion protein [Stellaceae bacterium]
MTTSTEGDAPTPLLRRVFGDRGRRVAAPTRPLRQRVRLPLMLAGPIVVAVVASWWYLTSGRYVSTDDAYVQAARTMISADVSGRVAAIEVQENQRVTKGQVLYRLDPNAFQVQVNDAKAQLGVAKLQVEALKATYQLKVADNKSAQETLDYAQREYDRQKKLVGLGVASQAQFDQASNALEVARQRVASTRHDIGNVLAQLGGNPDIPIDEHPSVQRAQAVVDAKQIDLNDTVIRAPENGIVTKVEQLQVGDYITAATPVFSLISDRLWVEANFKETELTHMRAGQDATVEIDTYPGIEFHAKVASLSPGTGLTFSLLPPENATGNWVKVVQRLPVRLTLDNVGPEIPLHAGLSVTVEVDTKHKRPWLVWLERGYDRFFGSARAAETKR